MMDFPGYALIQEVIDLNFLAGYEGNSGAIDADLNTLFNNLTGLGDFTSGGFTPDDPSGGSNGSGDAIVQNTGGFQVPGSQVEPGEQEMVPEPGSILVWGIVLSGLGGYAVRRRRRNAA